MDYDQDKVDEIVLALMLFTLHDGARAWKGYDWDLMDHLYQKGWIENPRNKNKSVVLTEEGLQKAQEFFDRHFRRTT